MNNEEAIELLEHELARFRDEPYDSLVARMSDGSICFVDVTRRNGRIGPVADDFNTGEPVKYTSTIALG